MSKAQDNVFKTIEKLFFVSKLVMIASIIGISYLVMMVMGWDENPVYFGAWIFAVIQLFIA